MGLSAVRCSIQTRYISIPYMPRDPRRVTGIECSHEGLSCAKVGILFDTTKRFRKKVNPHRINARLVKVTNWAFFLWD